MPMPEAWRSVIAAITAIAVLLTAGGAIVGWELGWVDSRLAERVVIYFKHQEEIKNRLDRIENRLLELERKN